MKYVLMLILGSFLFLQACKKSKGPTPATPPTTVTPPPVVPPSTYVPDNSFKVIAYFPNYRDPAGVDPSKYKMITHLFYTFLNANADGSLKALPQIARFNSVIATARANNVKVGISVAGPTELKTIAADAGLRTTLVKNLTNFVISNNLDGLDMDWESPRNNDGSHLTYVSLMRELSDSLHRKNKYLSAAITPGVYSGSVRDGILSDVFPYVDFFNIMIYDGEGWDSTEPLQHASNRMAETSLNYWLNTRGMPKEKAIVGLASYGISKTTPISKNFRDLVAAGANYKLDSASFTIDNVKHLYYYNGTQSIKIKSMMAKQRANGIMMWEFYNDTNDHKSLLKAACDTLGRSY